MTLHRFRNRNIQCFETVLRSSCDGTAPAKRIHDLTRVDEDAPSLREFRRSSTGSNRVSGHLQRCAGDDDLNLWSDPLINAELAGQTAIVTGAGSGIGAAIATRLAADGARVVVNYRASRVEAEKVVEAITVAGGNAMAVQADVTDPGTDRSPLRRGRSGLRHRKHSREQCCAGGSDAVLRAGCGQVRPSLRHQRARALSFAFSRSRDGSGPTADGSSTSRPGRRGLRNRVRSSTPARRGRSKP